MPYTADINRNNPGCFLFLVDQSGSMQGALGGQPGLRKMDGAADALNQTLTDVCQFCSRGMAVHDYFHIGLITYTTDSQGNPTVSAAFPGATLGQPFLLVSQVVDAAEFEERQVKESDGAGGIVEVTQGFQVWLRPTAGYGTPMCEALSAASKALQDWTAQHPDSHPPIVINITDGMATDGDPEPWAHEIMSRTTNDGNALLFNVHLSEVAAQPVLYPAEEGGLADDYAVKLFRMSSVFPEPIRNRALQELSAVDLPVTENSRGFVFNADRVALVQFLDIGTRVSASLQ